MGGPRTKKQMKIELKKIKNVLLIKMLYIGDVLLTTPAIRAFKEALPHAAISMAVYKDTAPVLEGNPHLTEILTFDNSHKRLPLPERIRREIAFVKEIRSRRFDLVVNLSNNDRGAILSFLSGAKYRIGQSRPKKSLIKNWNKLLFTHLYRIDNTHTHWAARHLEPLRLLGFEPDPGRLEIFLKEGEIREGNQLLIRNGWDGKKRLVHIHPTARLKSKYWRPEDVAEVTDYLISDVYDVVLTSGPGRGEMEALGKTVHLLKHKAINLAGMTSLRELAVISRLSSLFIGADSAPMHIASAAGTPVLALFGPMPVELWRPWGDGHTVLIKYMTCLPCGLDGCKNSGQSNCLDNLPPEAVIGMAKEMLGRHHRKDAPSVVCYV